MSFKPSIALAILLILAVIPLFGHLDELPIQIWDEARLGDNAMEMLRSHNWIVTQYYGYPDMWITKPPLMIWTQILFMKLFGFNELSMRLPSALAALGTYVFIFWLFAKKFQAPLPGMIAAIVLITIPGYVIRHGTRTGEYDSLLTLFTTIYAVFFFLYLEENKPKYLSATFTFLILAALTKGIQGLVFLPALMIYAIYRKKLFSVFREKQFYTGVVLFLFFVAGYYLLREHYNPGFIKTMQENEMGGRYTTVIENHGGDRWFYCNALIHDYFNYWYLLVVPGIVTGLFSKEKRIRNITVFSTVIATVYLIIISNAQTKAYWYLLPVYPFLSILVGMFLYKVCILLFNFEIFKKRLAYNILLFAFLFCVFFVPYLNIARYSLSSNPDAYVNYDRNNMEFFFQNVLRHANKNLYGSSMLDEDFGQDLYWYCLVFEHNLHPLNRIKRAEINAQGKILAFLPDSKKFLEENYHAQVVETYKNVVLYKLNGEK